MITVHFLRRWVLPRRSGHFYFPRPVSIRRPFTVRAEAFEIYRVIEQSKTAAARIGQIGDGQARILKVDNLAAEDANQVMMLLHVAIETSRGGKMIGATRQPQTCQSLQSPIDGRPRHTGNARSHVSENLIDRGMILSLDQRRKDDPALHRYGYSPAPAGGLKTFQRCRFSVIRAWQRLFLLLPYFPLPNGSEMQSIRFW